MTSPVPARWRSRSSTALAASGISVGVMWVLETLDILTHHALDTLGVTSWQFGDLWSVLVSWTIHYGFGHLVANTIPFLILGTLIGLGGLKQWASVTAVTALTSGLMAFILNPPNVTTAGASGVVFGYVAYLLARTWWTRRWGDAAIGLVVALIYGSVLWGMLPGTPGVSWQAHLGGALGGILAAWLLHRRRSARTV